MEALQCWESPARLSISMGGGDGSSLYLSARSDPDICILPLSILLMLIGIKRRNQNQSEEILEKMLRQPVDIEPGVFPLADVKSGDKVPIFCSSPHHFIFLRTKM